MKHVLLFAVCVALMSRTNAQVQNALDFDGVNDRVTVPNQSARIANAAGFTLTCWVYPRNTAPSFPNFDGFAGFRNETDCDFYLLQISPANTIEGRLRNNAGTVFTISYAGLQINTWQHLALVYNGSTLALYVNGSMATSMAASGTITNATVPLYIGDIQYQINDFWLNGKVDEVSLWSRALTTQELNCLKNHGTEMGATGLELYYQCNQGIAGGDNTAINLLTDSNGNADGNLTGFTLTGATSNFVAGPTFGTAVSATFCPGGSYAFHGQTLTAPGVYTAEIPTGNGCDSTVVLTLTQSVVNTNVVQNANVLIAQASGATFQWLRCATNQPIIGATNQYYTAFTVGEYAVIVTQNGCSDTSACYNVTTIGIEELAMPALRTWPQPTNGTLNVGLESTVKNATLRIVDLEGRVIEQRTYPTLQRIALDVQALAPGAYFLVVDRGGPRSVVRFVRE